MPSRRPLMLSVAILLVAACQLSGQDARRPLPEKSQAPPPPPPPPPPPSEVIRVGTAEQLELAVRRVQPGGTILLADGTYPVGRTLVLSGDDLTLRSESGQRERVILDGGGTLGELLTLRDCSDITIADVTLQNVRWNGIKIDSDTGVHRATIRNCVFRNIWQRGVKGVKVPAEQRKSTRPRQCVIEHCLFTNERPKRLGDDPADTAENFQGNYVGGIDVMYATEWIIRGNVFRGIRGRTGSARGAVFLWHDSRDCIVERNVIIDCDSGICLGNSHKPKDVSIHCTGVIVRNNFLCRVPENGILADYTRDCAILHNTIHDPQSRFGRLIRLVHENSGLRVINNLLSGPPLAIETKSPIELHDNLSRDFTAAFVAPEQGNLHLTVAATAAIDGAVPLAEVTEDIDRHRRHGPADIGADEWIPKPRGLKKITDPDEDRASRDSTPPQIPGNANR